MVFHALGSYNLFVIFAISCCGDCLGDEVVEWNGRSLQGASFEEVYDIILESKQEPQVELIVHRNVK